MDYFFFNLNVQQAAKKSQSKAKPLPELQLLVGRVDKGCEEVNWQVQSLGPWVDHQSICFFNETSKANCILLRISKTKTKVNCKCFMAENGGVDILWIVSILPGQSPTYFSKYPFPGFLQYRKIYSKVGNLDVLICFSEKICWILNRISAVPSQYLW